MKENIKDIKNQKALDDEGLDKVVGGANVETAALLRQNATELMQDNVFVQSENNAVQSANNVLQNLGQFTVASANSKEYGIVKKPEVK